MKSGAWPMINGQIKYVEAKVSIYFDPDHVACQYCPLLETYSRDKCRMTSEYIIDTRFTVGRYCPLIFKDEKENK